MSTSKESLNKQFGLSELKESDLDPDPIQQFRFWYEEAMESGFIHPNAFTLATSTIDGKPSARQLLLKDFDEKGFVFYTNSNSKKGKELANNPFAAICFWWDKLERQVRIEGKIELVPGYEAEEYYASRPRGSQLGAWASDQSSVIAKREILEDRVLKLEAQYRDKEVPRPPHWNGYRLIPGSIEFWQGRDNRLHDRLRYRLQSDGKWLVERLAP
jgi:pyridoxamine 5'-phosphate oxidase